MWSADGRRAGGDEGDDDEDSEEDSSEEESDDAGASNAPAGEASREARKAQKKARKEAAIAKQQGHNVQVGDLPSSDEDSDEDDEDGDMPANPNHSKAARKQAAAPVAGSDEDEDGVGEVTDGVKALKVPASRRERESLEAAAAKEKYMKLHTAGKTDEAKADLARLKLIREQRAGEAARRQVRVLA